MLNECLSVDKMFISEGNSACLYRNVLSLSGWDSVGNYAEYGAPHGFLRFWSLFLKQWIYYVRCSLTTLIQIRYH